MKARSPSSSTRTKRFRSPRAAMSDGQRGGKSRQWTCRQLIQELRRLGEKRNVEGMARFGIVAKDVCGVSKPKLDALATCIEKDHALALELWRCGLHDARILAGMIDDPELVTAGQMDAWAREFDNWDVCDGTCCHLFVFASPAWQKAVEWSSRKEEFNKRAAFALMAYLAYRDKVAPDAKFLKLLAIVRRHATDERNFVRKGVNWALRNIGKRNLRLNRAAIREARRIGRLDSRAARWIAGDALRELSSSAVRARLQKKAKTRQP
jgi:3-methyladenine DNA glycosylase AlkD